MRIKSNTKAFLLFSANLLRYKKGITLADIFCNTVIFCRVAAITYIVRQVLNILESSKGTALRQALPYLLALFAVIGIRIIAIMGCAVLDTLRSYYYQNRTRLNALRLLLEKKDITAVAGRSGPIYEILCNDISIATFPAELLTEVTGFFLFTLIAVSMMLSINWQLTIFIFVPLSAAVYFVQRSTEHIREKRRANRAAQDAAGIFTADVIDAAIAVKAADAGESVLRRYDQVNGSRRSAVLKDTLLNSKITVLLDGSVYIGSAVMMFAAARLMTGGSFGLGDFSLFISYLGTLADCVNRIVELVAESRKAEVSFERIVNAACTGNEKALDADAGITLRTVPPVQSVRPCYKPDFKCGSWKSLEVNNLSFDYGEGRGFKNINLRLAPSELAVVTGETGTGKSTFLNVLAGLLPSDTGTITLDGKIINGENRKSTEIAAAVQRGGFFSGTLRENVSLGLNSTDDEIMNALHLAAFDELANAAGLDSDSGSRGSRLSGGQQQRLALARMYLRCAKLNLIDDCISALDRETRLKVLGRLKDHLERSGSAAIIITGEQAFADAADQIIKIVSSKNSS
ncbi:MAG: ABC transporter ATP-binding protein/permease [Treponema sp.]|nr:ABC transporter ATP-binding protein/permease [Treponema sp.]